MEEESEEEMQQVFIDGTESKIIVKDTEKTRLMGNVTAGNLKLNTTVYGSERTISKDYSNKTFFRFG